MKFKHFLASIRRIISKTIFGIGLAVIGVLAVPAGLFVGVIIMIWTVTDHIMTALEK